MDVVFVLLRIAHVVAGVLWVGMTVFFAMLLLPALEDAGPAADRVVGGLAKRGAMWLPSVLAIVSLVSGVWLYGRMSGGLGWAFVASPTGATFGVGGVLAFSSLIVGLSVTRPAMMRAGRLLQSVGPATSAAERGRVEAEAARLRARGAAAGRVIAWMLIVAAGAMAVARYL